jgi:hypothetical protein
VDRAQRGARATSCSSRSTCRSTRWGGRRRSWGRWRATTSGSSRRFAPARASWSWKAGLRGRCSPAPTPRVGRRSSTEEPILIAARKPSLHKNRIHVANGGAVRRPARTTAKDLTGTGSVPSLASQMHSRTDSCEARRPPDEPTPPENTGDRQIWPTPLPNLNGRPLPHHRPRARARNARDHSPSRSWRVPLTLRRNRAVRQLAAPERASAMASSIGITVPTSPPRSTSRLRDR